MRAEEKRLSIGRKKKEREEGEEWRKGWLVGWFFRDGKKRCGAEIFFAANHVGGRGREILHMVQDGRVLKPKAFLLSSPTPFSLT